MSVAASQQRLAGRADRPWWDVLAPRPRPARRGALTAWLVCGLVVSGACGPSEPVGEYPVAAAAAPAVAGVVRALDPPTTGVSRAPALSRHGDRVVISWLEFANFRARLRYAFSTPEGWSEAQVAAEGDDFVDNAADISWVRALDDGTLVAQWPHGSSGNPEAYALALSWSRDGGLTWSPPVAPHHDGTEEQHGFASLFEPAGGWFGLVWLDGRDFSVAGLEDGAMGLWTASFGQDGQQTGETAIDARVCDCCQTSAVTTPDGIVVAYRDRSPDEVRDIQVVRQTADGWSAPTLVHAYGWTIHGCPVNGPAIAARDSRLAVAWFTAASGEGRALLAFSGDGGRTFEAPIRVDDGLARGLVDLEILPDGSGAVSWVELTGAGAEFRVRRIEPGGARSRALVVADVSGAHYPRLALAGDELRFAWTESGQGYTHLRTARVPAGELAAVGPG